MHIQAQIEIEIQRLYTRYQKHAVDTTKPSKSRVTAPVKSPATKIGLSTAEKCCAPMTVTIPSRPSRFTEYLPAPTRTGCGTKFDQTTVNFVINTSFPVHLADPPVKINRYHQVTATPHLLGFAESMSVCTSR